MANPRTVGAHGGNEQNDWRFALIHEQDDQDQQEVVQARVIIECVLLIGRRGLQATGSRLAAACYSMVFFGSLEPSVGVATL